MNMKENLQDLRLVRVLIHDTKWQKKEKKKKKIMNPKRQKKNQ